MRNSISIDNIAITICLPTQMRSRRPVDACLTLIQVNYWTLQPRLGLESLQATGKIPIDALRTLNSLMDLVAALTRDIDLPVLNLAPIQRLTASINAGEIVDEADIEAARQWVDHVANLLLRTKRSAYLNAINHLILVTESRELLRGIGRRDVLG